MATARDIADEIISRFHEAGSPITNLQLQKLMYYCQAWSLATRDTPLFEGDFEAWAHGPVHRPTYDRFSHLRWNPIPDAIEAPALEAGDREHVDDVLAAYGHITGYGLERLTHAELPWREARGDVPEWERCNNVISTATMRDFYAARALVA